jgi:predicted XRE-type DNA-binding protein
VKKTAKHGDPKLVIKSRSGNVFADLGLPHPEQELLKSRLTLQIYRLIKARGLKQAEAGKILGIKQPHVSLLMRNRSGSFFRGAPHGVSHRPWTGCGDNR